MGFLAQWTLVHQSTSYEYQWRGFSSVVCYRRQVDTWTYECTFDDESSIPGPPISPSADAQLESSEYTCALGQPLSRRRSATYTKKGPWEVAQ